MRSPNKVVLAKLCKKHHRVLHTTSHIHRYLSSRCLLSVFTKTSARKAKQSMAFGLLLLAGIFTTPVSAQTGGICDRTDEVESTILAAISGTSDCTAVTATQLAAITSLDLSNMSISALQSGDFAGLSALTELNLEDNDLSALPDGIFDPLTSLTNLELESNNLSALPAGIFSSVTGLTGLDLGDNMLSALPAGIFSGLTSLTELALVGNTFTTPLPADIFDPVSTATIQIDLSPIGDLAGVALTDGGTATINVANAFISREDDTGTPRTLMYAITADTNIATATESGGVLTITGEGMGTTTVSVTADDDSGGSRANVTRNIAVTVVETGILAFDEATGDTLATPIAAENGGTDMVYVQLASAPANDVTLTLTSSDANEGTVMPATLTFTAAAGATSWDTRQLVTVTAVNDNSDRDDTFTVNFAVTGGDGANYPTSLTLPSVTVTVTDDDTAGIDAYDMATGGNEVNAITTSETAGTGNAVTTYVELTSEPTGPVTVTIGGIDTTEHTLTTPASGTLTFTTTNWFTRQAVTFEGVDDNIVDGDQTYNITLTASGGGYDGVVETGSATNTDDDTAEISISGMNVNENAGTATLTVTLSAPVTAGTVTVDLTTMDGTATTAGGDYTALTSQTLTFAAGSTSETLDITINNDAIDEVDETFTVTLDNLMLPAAVTGDVSITDATARVAITDNDTLSDTINLSVSPLTVAETADATTITVTATIDGTAVSPTDTTVTVSVGESGDSAVEGTDYATVSDFTLTIPALSSSAMATFMIDPNTSSTNGDIVTISGTAGGFTTINSATLTIVEDGISVYDAMSAGSQISTATIADEASGTDTLYVQLVSQPATGSSVTISVTSSDTNEGTVSTPTLTFTDTDWDTRQPVTITAVDDNIHGNDDTFMVDFMVMSGDSVNYTSSLMLPSVTVTVIDNDVASDIVLTVSPNSVTETAGETSLTVTATLNGATSATDTAVEVIVSGGTASPGTDYTLSVPASTLTLPTSTLTLPTATLITIMIPAEMTSSSGVFAVIPIADDVSDNGETLTISGAASINSNIVTVNPTTLTIIEFSEEEDVVSTMINLSVSPDSVTETAGETSLTVTATLNGTTSATDTAVEIIVSGGTASPGTDYTLSVPASTLTLPTSTLTLPTATLITIMIPAEMTSSSGVFAVIPIADDVSDNGETLTISGAASINSNIVTVNPTTLTIIEFSEEEQQVIEQTVAAQASSITQVVSENIGSFLASRTSAPAAAPDGGGGGDINRENLTSIDWQDWQDRFAKLAYEGIQRLDSDADMSLDWALKAAGGDGRLLMPLGVESLTLWAAGGRLKIKGDGMGDYDGGVNSFVVGVDTNLINNWLLGIAASYSDSQVDYTMDGAPIGSNEYNLFSVHPFLSHSLPEHGLTLWVTGGYGVGDIDFSRTTNGEATSDITQWMAAGGVEKQIITRPPWQGALRLKGLWGNATVDATEFSGGGRINKVDTDFWRARMENEMGYHFRIRGGGSIRPYALIGGRWDHNDAIVSGDEWHIDIGGGVEVLSDNAFALNISVHTQLTDGDTEEDSIIGTGSLTYDIGHDRQGLQITLSRPLNNTSPSWDQHSFNELTDKVSGVTSAPLTSELAYGWTVRPFGLKGALQTYVQNSFESSDRHYAVGLELAVNALTLNFETGYHDHASLDSDEIDNTGLESMFKTKIRW